MALAALSYHANAAARSGASVPPQKPREADENQERRHSDCEVRKTKHLVCPASEHPVSFCASVILSVNGVQKSQSIDN